MGGKNCVIVDSDADLDDAVPAIVESAFGYAGQKCSAASRVLAHEAIAETLLERLAGATDSLIVGQAESFATDVPPVIEAEARDRIQPLPRGRRAAGRVVTGRETCRATAGSARRRSSPTCPPTRAVAATRRSSARWSRVEPVASVDRRASRSSTRSRSRSPAGCSRATRETIESVVATRPGRQPLRQPLDHRRDGRPPAVRRQPPLRDRQRRPAARTTCASSPSRARCPRTRCATVSRPTQADRELRASETEKAGRAIARPAWVRRVPGYGCYLRACLRRPVREFDGDIAAVATVLERQLDRVAWLLRVNSRDNVVHARDGIAVDGGDHVAAGVQRLAVDRDLRIARRDTRPYRRGCRTRPTAPARRCRRRG